MLTFQIFLKSYLSHSDLLFTKLSILIPLKIPHTAIPYDHMGIISICQLILQDLHQMRNWPCMKRNHFPLLSFFWSIRFYINPSDDYLLFSNSAATQYDSLGKILILQSLFIISHNPKAPKNTLLKPQPMGNICLQKMPRFGSSPRFSLYIIIWLF